MNPSSATDLKAALESLNEQIALTEQTLSRHLPLLALNKNMIECPFNPHHQMPPHALFRHFLRCSSSPRPLPDPNNLLLSLTYPKTLNNPPSPAIDPSSPQLSFSLNLDFASNFFYRDCPGAVSLSDAPTINPTFTLPPFLSVDCAHFSDTQTENSNSISNSNSERVCGPILPSEYWAITRELESWNDYPTTYNYYVLSGILGLGIAKESDLMIWLMENSHRYGVVIDTAMQQHIFLLSALCFKSILREAFVSVDKHNLRVDCSGMTFDCPILNQALTWLASQLSILYGATNAKFFVLHFIQKCVLVAASGLLLIPLRDDSKQESQSLDANSGDDKEAKPDSDAQHEEKTNCIQNRKIFVSQIAAAIAALHERSLLENKLRGFWFSQQPSKYQLVAEHHYLSERADEERKKRIDYRPLIDHDGVHRQQSSNQETYREKTREELLAEERDYKRRRMSYRGKNIKPSALQVMRDVIEEQMEEIKRAGTVESPVKVSEAGGMFPSKPPSVHNIPMETNNSRKVNHDSPAVTIGNSRSYEQQPHTKFSRDYEQDRQGHYRSHDYVKDQWNTGQGKHHRDHASTSPERRQSHSRSHEHSVHHKKQDYPNRKYDHLSKTRDHRTNIPDSSLKNAFLDRYDPSESLDICEGDISSDAKYIKLDKFDDKEFH